MWKSRWNQGFCYLQSCVVCKSAKAPSRSPMLEGTISSVFFVEVKTAFAKAPLSFFFLQRSITPSSVFARLFSHNHSNISCSSSGNNNSSSSSGGRGEALNVLIVIPTVVCYCCRMGKVSPRTGQYISCRLPRFVFPRGKWVFLCREALLFYSVFWAKWNISMALKS